jgi:23S rRNA (cytosine1962-C5)-methyltransferase
MMQEARSPEREAVVGRRGAARWARGHPWIYRSDVRAEPAGEGPGVVVVRDEGGVFLGRALYSPASEIRLRLLEIRDEPVDRDWWRDRIGRAAERRRGIEASAYRLVHAEADGLPSLVVDRYGSCLVVELLSAGLEARRAEIVDALSDLFSPTGILLRNDSPVRRHEALPREVDLARGRVPEDVEVEEGGVRYLAAPWTGQKTGAFLDQRENRALAGRLAATMSGTRPQGVRALDAFTYHGSFALHLAAAGARVVAVDQSGPALERGRRNQALGGLEGIEWVEANAFDLLRERADRGARFDLVVLDPPAFARSKSSVRGALRGYKEINLRAMSLLAPGGRLLTFSCSYHVGRERFLDMLADAASDSGRPLVLERVLGQARDHPHVLTIPETGYLKGALLRARA